MNPWEKLFQELEIIGTRRKSRVATEATIKAFEQKRSIPLPPSYRQFATIFGAGELAGYYRFAVPLNRKDDYDLETNDGFAHDPRAAGVWDDHVPEGVFPHMLFFGATIGGELFAWRINEPSKKGKNLEYRIYRFNDLAPAKVVGDNFSDFAQNCLQGKLDQLSDEEGNGPTQSFMRY